VKNNVQFVQETGVNYISQSNFFKNNANSNINSDDRNDRNDDHALSNWEKKPAKCKMM